MDITNYEETLPIVASNGNTIGKATRRQAHGPGKPLHPVVHLHLFNSHGDLYLQLRPMWKDVQPGKWDTATGGHVAYGESIGEALLREVSEELGITGYEPEFLGRYVYESEVERELVHVYRTVYDGEVHPDANELAGGRFWTRAEIRSAIGKSLLTPNFESEYNRFFACKEQ